MTDMSAIPPGISVADWSRTPETIRLLVVAQGGALSKQQQVIAEQQQANAEQQQAMVRQQEEIVRLTERLARVEERLGRNRRNSSKPPSSGRQVGGSS